MVRVRVVRVSVVRPTVQFHERPCSWYDLWMRFRWCLPTDFCVEVIMGLWVRYRIVSEDIWVV